ncbi:MAG: hypothetical protein EP330_19810 [Deltaproteobacteria bacterium]|nr:MAG: hypothetical protein EP330_19810 [Deltaproteobacteria bacterium]
MAFTALFRTRGPVPPPDDVADWCVQLGEAFDRESSDTIQLRALPVRVVVLEDSMKASLEIDARVPLERLVDFLFEVSSRAGSDVHLAGEGAMTRPQMWMRLADEQDRQRIVGALDRAEEHGNSLEVVRRLWGVLAATRPGMDIRWDNVRKTIVALKEVDEPGGISLAEASWLVEDITVGDVIAVPVAGYLHILAWRWLSEAYPHLTA